MCYFVKVLLNATKGRCRQAVYSDEKNYKKAPGSSMSCQGLLWWAHWIGTSVLACQLGQSKTVSTADQLPTESELSGCQRGNPSFMRGSGGSHKLSADLKTVFRGGQKRNIRGTNLGEGSIKR